MLTSGGRPTALEGVETLAELVDRAGEQIAVMAGGRLDFDNLETIIRQSGVREVHLGSAVSRSTRCNPARLETSWNQTDPQRVAAVVSLVRGLRSSHG